MPHSGNWYPVGPVKWDAQGNPYHDTSDGQKAYIAPMAAAQERGDPKLLAWAKAHGANVTYGANDVNGNPTVSNVRTGAPDNSYMHGQPTWDSETGSWKYPQFFDTPFGSTVLGSAAVAGPVAYSALYGPSAAAPTLEASMNAGVDATVAPTTAAGSTAAAAGGAAATKGAGVGSNIWGQIISGGLNLFGAKQSADASERAAQIQADAANRAALLAYQAGQNTLDFQKSQWDTAQANMAPWLRTGQSAIRSLGDLMGLSSSGSGAVPVRRSAPQMPPSATMSSLYPPTGGAQAPAAPAQAAKTPDYVRITWPDGHGDTVPSRSVSQYQLLGAQVVG